MAGRFGHAAVDMIGSVSKRFVQKLQIIFDEQSCLGRFTAEDNDDVFFSGE